jgi:hypothetical protein
MFVVSISLRFVNCWFLDFLTVNQCNISPPVKHLVLERRLKSAQTLFFAVSGSGMVATQMTNKARIMVESLQRQVTASTKKLTESAIRLPSQDTVEYTVALQLSFLFEINDFLSQINMRREELRARRHVSNLQLPFAAPSSKSTRLKSTDHFL